MLLKPYAVALALLLQAGATQLPPPSPTPPKATQDQQNAAGQIRDSDNQKGNTTPAPPPAISEVKPQIDSGENRDMQAPPSDQSSDQRIVVLTGALVLVGLIQAIVYIWQGSLMREGLRETMKAADAAAKNALSARQALVDLNRPWLETLDWGMSFNNGRWLIEYKVANRSKTPARIERIEVNRYLGGRDPMTLEHTVETVISPEFSAGFPISLPLEQADETALNNANLLIQIRGEITYADIFGNRRHKLFARDCRAGRIHQYFVIPEGAGLNDEREWPKPEPEA
jgi:hypothetical protein